MRGLNITFRQIRYFVSAAQNGSISAASSAVGISQSAITEAIRTLELEIGRPLFHRHTKGVTLTVAGQRFHRNACGILDAVADIRNGVDLPLGMCGGALRIGVTPLVSACMIADLLARYRKLNPGAELTVQEQSCAEIEGMLAEDEIDFAVLITSHLLATNTLEQEKLLSCGWRLWMSPTHPLATREAITLQEASREDLIIGCMDELQATAERIWRSANASPRIAMRTTSFEAVRSLVAMGSGVALMPDLVGRGGSAKGGRILARRIEDRIETIDIGIVWPRNGAGKLPADNFLRVARAMVTA